MRVAATVLTAVALFLLGLSLIVGVSNAGAHLVRYPDHPQRNHLENRLASQEQNLAHARYVARHGAGANKRWHRLAIRWITEELLETRRALRWHLAPIPAIEVVFGTDAGDALEVALCESDYYPRDGVPDTVARNGQYRGMFQMGSSERATYGHSSTAYGQARAAYSYFVASGRDWSPWECKP